MSSVSWDKYFLDIANEVSKKSHCMSRRLGCLIVKDRTILSTGYNGPPMGVSHCEFRDDDGSYWHNNPLGIATPKCTRQRMGFKSGEGLEYCPAVHAEANAIVMAARNGISTKDSVLYLNSDVTPCRECAKLIINAGIKAVILAGEPVVYQQAGILGYDLLAKHARIVVRNGLRNEKYYL